MDNTGQKSNAGKKSHVSRDDIRNTLHTHFHMQASKQQAKLSATRSARKHIFSFIQVKKVKGPSNKRIFGSFGSSKCKLLCITTQEDKTNRPVLANEEGKNRKVQLIAYLHYVDFQTNYTIDVRKSWKCDSLASIENCRSEDDGNNRGSFLLQFQDEDVQNVQWSIDVTEAETAMKEFVWGLCALSIDINVSVQFIYEDTDV